VETREPNAEAARSILAGHQAIFNAMRRGAWAD